MALRSFRIKYSNVSTSVPPASTAIALWILPKPALLISSFNRRNRSVSRSRLITKIGQSRRVCGKGGQALRFLRLSCTPPLSSAPKQPHKVAPQEPSPPRETVPAYAFRPSVSLRGGPSSGLGRQASSKHPSRRGMRSLYAWCVCQIAVFRGLSRVTCSSRRCAPPKVSRYAWAPDGSRAPSRVWTVWDGWPRWSTGAPGSRGRKERSLAA
jgi:hypothetical protein